LFEIMKAEGEVGTSKNALEWINKQDSPFVKAMALTGLAEGLANRQKSQAKPKDKQSNAQAAEKDFQIAEFYRRTGHPASAHFYYDCWSAAILRPPSENWPRIGWVSLSNTFAWAAAPTVKRSPLAIRENPRYHGHSQRRDPLWYERRDCS
jgi:hypothetical protein